MDTEPLDPLTLDFLWEALDAGELPYPLEIRSHGATMNERAALRRRVHEDLRARQLLDHAGRLAPELEAWLGALAAPRLSIDSVFLPELAAEPVRALAAASRGSAILAVQSAAGLSLRKIPSDGLVMAIVGLLPFARRGTEQSVTLPAEDFAAVAPARGGVMRGNPASGRVAVNSRNELGGRRRSPVLAWFDNPSGRYLTQERVGSDGTKWATVAPADAATLRKRIAEMVGLVTAEGR